jgi:hypothetical protein
MVVVDGGFIQYNHIMVFWVVTCFNVGGHKYLKEHVNSIFRIKVKGKDVVRLYGHVTGKMITENHRWTLKFGEA